MNTTISTNRQLGNRQLARALCIGLLMQGLTGCQDAEKPQPGTGDAFPLSLFEKMIPVDNGNVDTEGKILLINFWATWCAPCREEMPALQELSDTLDPERFAVIGISVDEDRNLIREFMLQYEIRFPVYQDDKFRLAGELLGIKTFPETFIVSPQGLITRRISEALPPDFGMTELFIESGEKADTIKSDSRING
ncbi:MAG: TlpA family protein disulfide reductase [Gammaproteobacteria bacterium]|nr:TlpA family protein disulfide reductase [Gammaproteobacteria bacterium]MDH3858497.1 TlpA family protein disulfide reductase [Gammaproteobacteria bacterium]